MKRVLLILAAVAGLTACASNDRFYAMQETLIKEVVSLKAKAADLDIQKEKTRQATMTAIGPKLDATGAAVVGALAVLPYPAGGGIKDESGDLLKLVALQRPPESWDDKALKWASVILGGYKIFVDKEVGIANVNANKEIQTALYSMVAQINRDTGAAVASGRSTTPTYQYTTNVENSQGVAVNGGTGTYLGPLTLTCSSATGPGGDGAPGGVGGQGGATTAVGGVGGAGGSGSPSGSPPVNCTVTRG